MYLFASKPCVSCSHTFCSSCSCSCSQLTLVKQPYRCMVGLPCCFCWHPSLLPLLLHSCSSEWPAAFFHKQKCRQLSESMLSQLLVFASWSKLDMLSSCLCRNAGEMKGVTMEENKQQLAALKKLLDLPHNKQCADCTGGGGAARASWASINTGVFICMRCAGIHRGLGVHVSKVCSVVQCHTLALKMHRQQLWKPRFLKGS